MFYTFTARCERCECCESGCLMERGLDPLKMEYEINSYGPGWVVESLADVVVQDTVGLDGPPASDV